MNGAQTAGYATAAVLTLGMIGSIIALAYRIGVLSGTVLGFMRQSETHRTEVLKEIGKLDERLDRHIDQHHTVSGRQ